MSRPEDIHKAREALRAAIKRSGLTMNAWAKTAGIAEGTLRHFLGARTDSLNDATYAKMAAAHKVPVGVLRGHEPAGGEEVHPFDGDSQIPIEYVPAPPGLDGGNAVIVRGDSMVPMFADGDTLYYVPEDIQPDRASQEACVVQVRDGPIFVKRPIRGTRKGLWHLLSVNPAVPPIEDQRVLWCARIQWVKRRAS